VARQFFVFAGDDWDGLAAFSPMFGQRLGRMQLPVV